VKAQTHYEIMPGAETTLLHGNLKTGILLVHGFCGAPNEVQCLANAFSSKGYTVYSIRLTGHGTHPRELHGTRWTHWVNDIEDGLTLLATLCDEIILCGFSMGGTLCVQATAKHPEVKLLITLDAPMGKNLCWCAPLFTPLSWLIPIFSPLPLAKLVMDEDRKIAIDRLVKSNIGYTSFSARSFGEFYRLIRYTTPLAAQVQQPTLVIHSHKDDVVPFKQGELLLRTISTTRKDHLWLEESRHNVLFGTEKDQIIQKIITFLDTYD